jgi:hypothetical protein
MYFIGKEPISQLNKFITLLVPQDRFPQQISPLLPFSSLTLTWPRSGPYLGPTGLLPSSGNPGPPATATSSHFAPSPTVAYANEATTPLSLHHTTAEAEINSLVHHRRPGASPSARMSWGKATADTLQASVPQQTRSHYLTIIQVYGHNKERPTSCFS